MRFDTTRVDYRVTGEYAPPPSRPLASQISLAKTRDCNSLLEDEDLPQLADTLKAALVYVLRRVVDDHPLAGPKGDDASSIAPAPMPLASLQTLSPQRQAI